ncbi:uncharacterized protein LOC117526217 isoform X1 [Lates japonicus]
MFVVVCAIALLCFVSVSHSAPLACEELVRPLDQLDPLNLEGRWALVTGSLNDSASAEAVKGRDSVTIEFNNSSYTQANHFGDRCEYYSHNISKGGNIFNIKVKTFNFTGSLLHTSWSDCLVLRLDVDSPNYKSLDLYLFSRRREVTQKVMEDFRAQAECLSIPPPFVMDPTKELCPEEPGTEEENP